MDTTKELTKQLENDCTKDRIFFYEINGLCITDAILQVLARVPIIFAVYQAVTSKSCGPYPKFTYIVEKTGANIYEDLCLR